MSVQRKNDRQIRYHGWKDFEWFLDKGKRIVKRIRELLKDIGCHPERASANPSG
jgi:Txe/YoeB family toxin of Txe-Axe toxin-antitoxin module